MKDGRFYVFHLTNWKVCNLQLHKKSKKQKYILRFYSKIVNEIKHAVCKLLVVIPFPSASTKDGVVDSYYYDQRNAI